jgi:hypothetical protein
MSFAAIRHPSATICRPPSVAPCLAVCLVPGVLAGDLLQCLRAAARRMAIVPHPCESGAGAAACGGAVGGFEWTELSHESKTLR